MSNPQRSEESGSPTPWWRVPMVWLVISGPLIVVIASFVSLGLAVKYPDPVLRTADDVGQSAGGVKDAAGSGIKSSTANLPAMEARNHAATGGR